MEQACALYEMRFVALGFFAWVGEKCGEWGARFHSPDAKLAQYEHNGQMLIS